MEHHDLEKKDKEEKRDEPLFQRLFGSRISGRRPSRGSGDDSRENSVSPLRRGGDQRASREKRRDSGSRFPVIGGASKTRQESHPLPPSGRAREPSKERIAKEVPSSSPQTSQSVSVEGPSENITSGHQATFRVSSFDEHPSRPPEGVRKAKSFREVPEQNVTHRNIIRRKVSPQTNVEDQSGVPAKVSRLSSSLESLDGDNDTRKSTARPVAPSKLTQIETSASPQRSSTDSLTTTPLPGVFIRQHSQNQNKTVLQKHQEHQQQLSGQELNSGPFSLDSSIGVHSCESEESLRKAASVDHMSYTIDPECHTKEAETTELTTKTAEAKPVTASQSVTLEEKTESGKPESKKSPGHTLRSYLTQKSEEILTQGPTPDEGEVEGDSVPHRPVRKEPSMKRPLRDPKPAQVPEFMRIQLNRVESKGQSVIYDTEQERNAKTESKEVEVSSKKPETSSVTESTQKEMQISDRPTESFSTKKEASSVLSSKENKTPTSHTKKSNVQGSRGLFRDVSPSGSNVESGDSDFGVEGTLPEPSLDRVVLRKPLVSERAPVVERAGSATSQTPSAPSKREQPELFKVFARRSFKVKDVDKDKPESSDVDETNVEASSEVSEVIVSPVRAQSNSSPAPVSIGSSLTSVSTSQSSADLLQKPSINAISFNRKSVGNPALSFCPPPVSTSNAPVSSPVNSKPMVLVLSNNSNVDTSSTEITITSSLPRSINTITTTSSSITTSTSPSKPTTAPIQVSTIHPANTNSVAPAVSESFITVSTTPPSGIISKIISNRTSCVTSVSDGGSGNESDSSSAAPALTTAPSKPPVSSRSGSGLIWPPRPHQDQEDSLQPAQQTQIPAVLPVLLNSQQKKLSTSSISDCEGTQDFEQTEEIEVEISPLDIGAARRRFMSGGKDRSHGPATPSTQNVLPASTSPVLSPLQSGSISNPSSGTPVSVANKTGPSVTEARNNTPSFTITVRTQAAPTTCRSDTLPTSASVTSPSTDLNSSTVTTSSNTSIGKSEQGAAQQAADDWRVLVRQRREGRLKQTKTPDSEEIIIEVSVYVYIFFL